VVSGSYWPMGGGPRGRIKPRTQLHRLMLRLRSMLRLMQRLMRCLHIDRSLLHSWMLRLFTRRRLIERLLVDGSGEVMCDFQVCVPLYITLYF
jgi:hypothetical protein